MLYIESQLKMSTDNFKLINHKMGISFLFSFAFHFHLFTAICKASSDSHFAFLHFFLLGMVLIPVSCRMSQTCLVKAMVFPVVMYGCESWTIKKAEHRRIEVEESLGLQGDLTSPS